VIDTDIPAVFAHRLSWEGRVLIFLHNLDDTGHEVMLGLRPEERAHGLLDLFGNQLYEATGKEPRRFALDAYGYRWLRMHR
jgi:maltose alpha-D-glucosyltransferase / alpha-amylase